MNSNTAYTATAQLDVSTIELSGISDTTEVKIWVEQNGFFRQIIALPLQKKVVSISKPADDNILTFGAFRDLIYPVGSIYMSMNSINPSTFIGGTWKQITDRFLYCVNRSKTTGGSAYISVDQLPAHNHGLNGHSWHWGIGTSTVYSTGVAVGGGAPNNNLCTYQGEWNKTISTGSGTAYYPPYMTCYAWYRTA